MYIFELIANAFKSKKYHKFEYAEDDTVQKQESIDEEEKCEHFFLPIDSTNTIFACKYCGLIASKEELKKYNQANPFR